jgi:hypothetical protein
MQSIIHFPRKLINYNVTTHNEKINCSYKFVHKELIRLSKTSKYKPLADYARCRSKYYEIFYDIKDF